MSALIARQRSAFTMIELLVVIGLFGLLLALLLPAIQGARAAAQRLMCASNLRQIGLALHYHHQDHGFFPHNGGWDGRQQIQARDGSRFHPTTDEAETRITWHWGVGDPTKSLRNQTGSWLYTILPYLEQQSVYEQHRWDVGIKLYSCSSRREATAREPVDDQYGRYNGGGWKWGRTDYAGNGLVFPSKLNNPQGQLQPARIASLVDGTSATILAGEKAMAVKDYDSGTWYWDEGFFIGGSGSTARSGPIVFPDRFVSRPIHFRNNWGSAHTGGAFFFYVGKLGWMSLASSWRK
jgi:prepilin-type N-terminal cleavage/methylation domain-containing protein